MFRADRKPDSDDTRARLLHSISVATLGGAVMSLLEKGASLPDEVTRIFPTATDNQTLRGIHLLYGGGKLVTTNASLGILKLESFPSVAKGTPQIEIILRIDAQHNLFATAKDRGTGREGRLDNPINLLQYHVPPYHDMPCPHYDYMRQIERLTGPDSFNEMFDVIVNSKLDRKNAVPLIEIHLPLTVREAELGTEKTVEFKRLDMCPTCEGSAGQPGTPFLKCPKCNGKKQVKRMRLTLFDDVVIYEPCPRCMASGSIPQVRCQQCQGNRQVLMKKELTIKSPSHLATGTIFRFSGEGHICSDGRVRSTVLVKTQITP